MTFFKQNWFKTILVVSFIFIPLVVSAHQSGCHRWHSCPSDSGSYTCGDTGYCSGCPNNYYCKNGAYNPGQQQIIYTPSSTKKPTPQPTPNLTQEVGASSTAYYKNPNWFREKLIHDLINEFGSQYKDTISRLVYTLLPDAKN